MNPYSELKVLKSVFENRRRALEVGSPEIRTYSEKQYVAQIMKIIGVCEKILLNGEFVIDVKNEMNDSIGVMGHKLKMAEIDNLLIIQSNSDNSYEMKALADNLTEVVESGSLGDKNFMLIPKDAVALTAKVTLHEDEIDEGEYCE